MARRRIRRNAGCLQAASVDSAHSYDDGCDSLSDDESNNTSRTRDLDDALFSFFRKEAVKSLKRNFSHFCRDSKFDEPDGHIKSGRFVGLSRSAFTSYSTMFFGEVVKKLSPRQKDAIDRFGAGNFLFYQNTEVPSDFVRWLAKHVDVFSSEIIVDNKVIPVSKMSVHDALGVPNCGRAIVSDHVAGRSFILSMFQLSEMRHITFFSVEVFVCFMVIIVSCFLCPTQSGCPNTEFLAFLAVPSEAKCYDLSQLVYGRFISGISKFNHMRKAQGRKPKHFEFCSYFLVVHYLSKLDFGAMNVDERMPLIAVFRGVVVKQLAELDRKSKRVFGKRQLKQKGSSVYERGSGSASTFESFSPSFRKKLHCALGPSLHVEAINGVIDIVLKSLSQKFNTSVSDCESLASNVLYFLRDSTLFENCAARLCNAAPPMQAPPSAINRRNSNSDIPTVVPDLHANTSILLPDAKVDVTKEGTTIADIKVVSTGAAACVTEPARRATRIKTNKGNFLATLDSGDIDARDCAITKFVESFAARAAKDPQRYPIQKVKARMCRFISKEQEAALLKGNKVGAGGEVDCNQGGHNPCLFPLTEGDNFGIKNQEGYERLRSNMSPVSRFDLTSTPCNKVGPYAQTIYWCFAVLQDKPKLKSAVQGNHQKVVVDLSSLEAVVVAEKNFKTRCTNLSKENNIMYNKSIQSSIVEPNQSNVKQQEPHLLANQRHAPFLAKELVGTKRRANAITNVIQNRNINQHGRFPVSDDDITHYSVIVILSQNGVIGKWVAIRYTKVHCSYMTLGESLRPEGHVDTFLIPYFCRKLFEDRHPTSSGKHHFFSYVGESILKFQYAEQEVFIRTSFEGAARASRNKELGQSDALHFPICFGDHWFLYAVDFNDRLFAFLDSLFEPNSEYHEYVRDRMINNFVHLWEVIVNEEHNFDSFSIIYPNVPRQRNVHDCGIFVMKMMEVWTPNVNLEDIFNADDIDNIRIQYANQLYFARQNEVDRHVVTSYHS